ncbi:MAG: NAD(P)/FAD-dependent oxidoreductase [Parvularculaceae bacterium]|nr:NAD(P)/FAD-dependent oxidoreductase [Parvularculaceae bacterium]
MAAARQVAVVGAGVMGLSAAYHLAKAGARPVVFERDRIAGGMAAHFDFDGLSIERFYHFVCKSDRPTFELLDEIGLSGAMRWTPTSMGYFYGGAVHRWGDPFSLLAFPHLSFIEKLRYGLHAFTSTKRSDWRKLDALATDDWVRAWIGERAFVKLWEPLLRLKFYEYADDVSAAWIWTRIKRVGTSRRNLLQEELGYIDGGSETLVRRLVERITALGGEVRLGEGVDEIALGADGVEGVRVGGRMEPFRQAISTAPLPYVPAMIPRLPAQVAEKLIAQKNIGVVCVLFKLKRSVTPHFWVNISAPDAAIPGVIEFTRLRPLGDAHVVYAPFYMPQSHPKWRYTDGQFVDEAFGELRRLNPALSRADIMATRVGRLKHAQPLCPPRFLESLPPIAVGVPGLQICDTSYYYPEDRGVAESTRFGKRMAETALAGEDGRA